MLRIVVCAKYSVDVSELRFDPSTGEPIVAGAKMKISDVDKRAIEEALRLKERHNGHVTVMTVGPESAKMGLREALAMGADEAYLLVDPLFEGIDTLVTAIILKKAIEKLEGYDLIICGEATSDGYSSLVGPRLAGLLGIPQVAYAKSIVEVKDGAIVVERDLEDRYEIVEVRLPALLTVIREINEPRIPPLPAIMRASKKPMKMLNASELGLSSESLGQIGSAVQILEVKAPEIKRKGVIFEEIPASEAVKKLVEALVKEGILSG